MTNKGRCIDCKHYVTCGLRQRPMLVIPPSDWVAEFKRIMNETREIQPACDKGVE